MTSSRNVTRLNETLEISGCILCSFSRGDRVGGRERPEIRLNTRCFKKLAGENYKFRLNVAISIKMNAN